MIAAEQFIVLGMIAAAVILIIIGARLAWRQQRQKQADAEFNHLVAVLDQGKLIGLRVETNNDQFLCYNVRTQDFVCQGRSLVEIKSKFKQRFPNKDAAIVDGDETAIQTLKQQVKDLYESGNSVRSAS